MGAEDWARHPGTQGIAPACGGGSTYLDIRLIIPDDTPPTGGNRITANRLRQALAMKNFQVDLWALSDKYPSADIYHAFNASKVGAALCERGVDPLSIVVTWTGTDLWQDWVKNDRGLRAALADIPHQVVFTEDAKAHLLQKAPEWADRIHVIPPSVNTDIFCPDGSVQDFPHPFCLLAGGIRPVKRSAWAIDLVEGLRRATGQNIHLAIAGPVRQLDEWKNIQSKAVGFDWVHMLGEIPAVEMPRWYRSAAVVLNTSLVEGVSNAIMEAMACGSLVMATNIAGNRHLIEDGTTGLLFDDPQELIRKLSPVLANPESVRPIRESAREAILHRHSLAAESEAYISLYERGVALRGCRR